MAEYLINYSDNIGTDDGQWSNGTLVYLGVDDEKELSRWIDKLNERGSQNSYFVEPDFDNEVTAVAALDYPDRRLEKLFKDLLLL